MSQGGYIYTYRPCTWNILQTCRLRIFVHNKLLHIPLNGDFDIVCLCLHMQINKNWWDTNFIIKQQTRSYCCAPFCKLPCSIFILLKNIYIDKYIMYALLTIWHVMFIICLFVTNFVGGPSSLTRNCQHFLLLFPAQNPTSHWRHLSFVLMFFLCSTAPHAEWLWQFFLAPFLVVR